MLIIKFVLSIQCQYSLCRDDLQYQVRPFKCPKFDASRILGEQNLRKKMGKYSQNLNCNKMAYLIKNTLTVQFPKKKLQKRATY